MYVVTFYSFKGGVGRTMALVNTSVALARAGRRVLVVDFDLEAPGLPSYSVFQDVPCGAGVVDYVTAYRTTAVAPKAADYIYPCDVGASRLWIMPAGRHTQPGYTEALNSIDWQDLYDNQDGYLMFEDLKQQWSQFEGKGFDYVLIDSRTGHTDVGGICTRQLPDAVVIMFVPNDQNIVGLEPIVHGIKAERHRRKTIDMLFCPSNVPDLDDEYEILSKRLEKASENFGYDKDQAPIVNHYASLDVLAQKVFVLTRANTKLAQQYEELRASIISLNSEDAEGARIALSRLPAQYERARALRKTDAREVIHAKVVDIRARHPADGEIAFLAATVLDHIGEPNGQIEALKAAIDGGFETNRSLLSRAYAYLSISKPDDALADLYSIIDAPTATLFELAPALQLLPELGADRAVAVQRALERPDTEYRTLNSLAWFAMAHRAMLGPVADRMEQLSQSSSLSAGQRHDSKTKALLAMVGTGQFARATQFADKSDRPLTVRGDLADLFNLMIADWGEQGRPSIETLERLREGFRQFDKEEDVNSHQCSALTHALLGDREAARLEVEAARARLGSGDFEFSCWRYLYVDGEELATDLDEMAHALDKGESLIPAFFTELNVALN